MAQGFRVPRTSRWRRALLPAALGMSSLAQAPVTGTEAAGAPQDVETALHQMSDKADVIFVGHVTAVKRQDGEGIASGVVEVDFQVDQAVRGCTAGTPYALREWAGLWEGDDQRYRVGQRLLMLLHAPGAAGMSSPVDGMDGAIPIVRGGSGALVAGSSARVAPPAVDLRWVGAKLLHSVSYSGGRTRGVGSAVERAQPRARGVAAAPGSAAGSTAGSAAGSEAGGALSEGPGEASLPAQQASVDVVVGMLTSWQKAQYGVR
jgi:hypothetical protein